MGEYHLIGEPIDQGNRPAVFELKIHGHLPLIEPNLFGLPDDTPTIDPHYYFITSGDALAKSIKLWRDILELIKELHGKYARPITIKGKKKWIYKKGYRKYVETVLECAKSCQEMTNKLREAKGPNCFLETEWREQHLITIPKNPRVRTNIIHAQ